MARAATWWSVRCPISWVPEPASCWVRMVSAAPWCSRSRPRTGTTPPLPDRTLAERRILVVEDEYMLADDLQIELEKVGAIVLAPLPDVEAALAFLAGDAELDGAVLDINLRGEASYRVADEL